MRLLRAAALPIALCAALFGAPLAAQDGAESGRSNRLKLAADAPTMGSATAPIVMVEVVDFRCPFCAEQAEAVLDEIVRLYVDTGIVRYVALDLPLPRHPEAERDAMAVRCADEQGLYWLAHRALFTERRQLGAGELDLAAFATVTGLDADRLAACVASGRPLAAVREDAERAMAIGVDATPTFLFGFPDEGGTAVLVARHLEGAVGLAPVVEAIEALRESLRQRALRELVDR